MPIDASRLQRDLETIAGFTHSPGNGSDRPTFSAEWAKAVEYVVNEAKKVSCSHRVDAAGNIHLRPASYDGKQVWLSGSHVDSVPHGGDFDGVTGVVVPLELLRAASEDKRNLPLELVIFAEEEGTTFGLGMLGSRTWAGTLDAKRLAEVRNVHGQSYLEAGVKHGVDANRFAAEMLRPADYRGLVEVHVEQGPGMWKNDQPVALVTAIAGRRQYRADVGGTANHAGSTGMRDRRDALAGAAEMIVALETFAPGLSPQVVCTVGSIEVLPNAVNVIANETSFTIDFRAPSDELLARGDAEIRRLLNQIAEHRHLELSIDGTESLPAVALSKEVCDRLRSAAKREGHDAIPETVSGALHDAAILAPHVPTAMLFVASRDGISHNPDEFSRIEDIATAAKILYTALAEDAAT